MRKLLGIAAVEQNDFFPFGKQTFYFEDMINSASDLDVDTFVFSPLDWNSDNNEVEGYCFKVGKWSKTKVPFPKIIYDRAFAKSIEDKTKIDEFRKFLKHNKIPVLNPVDYADLLNHKIEFHKFLIENGLQTLEAMPVNYILSKYFLEAVKQSKEFYLKPTFGTGGFGIHFISMQEKLFTLKNHTNTSTETFETIPQLFDFISKSIDIKEYFVQPKAEIVYYNESPFDIRVIIQNYGISDYRVTGMGVRIGKQKSFVSNLNSGGSALPLEALSDYYQTYFSKDIFKEIENISTICLECCKALDKTFGNFLEIGFDILLTKDKGAIILEGNSKPSRWIFNVLAEYYKGNPEQVEKYKKLRRETVRVPLLFTERNYPEN